MEGIRNQRKNGQERIDNSALVVGLYNQDSSIPVANFFTINLPSGRTEDVRAWLWYHPVTPRSCGYGDVTATYIRRSEIPSRIYAKHSVHARIRVRKQWCIIHSNTWVQLQSYHQRWSNITWILQHRYAQLREYKEMYKYEQYKRRLRVLTGKL